MTLGKVTLAVNGIL